MIEDKLHVETDLQFVKKSQGKINLKTTPGVWVNGKCYWVLNSYEKLIHDESLTVRMRRKQPHSKIQYYDISITNHSNETKKVKVLVMNRHENAAVDHFSFISPVENVIFHLADQSVSLVNGQFNGRKIEHCTIQPFWNVHTDGFWSSLEKGELKYHPMAKGIAASIFTLNIEIPPNQTRIANTWVITEGSKSELLRLNNALIKIHTSISNEKVIL